MKNKNLFQRLYFDNFIDKDLVLHPIKVIYEDNIRLEIVLAESLVGKFGRIFNLTIDDPLLFRSFNESTLMNLWAKYHIPDRSYLNFSKQTDYLDLLHKSSHGLYENDDLMHLLIGFEQIIEVICFSETNISINEVLSESEKVKYLNDIHN